MTLDEWSAQQGPFLKQLEASSHRWARNYDGAIDDMAWQPPDEDGVASIHSGPRCLECGYHFCSACVLYWDESFKDACDTGRDTRDDE
jgi:hypothetical protein